MRIGCASWRLRMTCLERCQRYLGRGPQPDDEREEGPGHRRAESDKGEGPRRNSSIPRGYQRATMSTSCSAPRHCLRQKMKIGKIPACCELSTLAAEGPPMSINILTQGSPHARPGALRSWAAGGMRVSEVARQAGVSRQNASKLLAGARWDGPMSDRSSRPCRLAETIPPGVEERVLGARRSMLCSPRPRSRPPRACPPAHERGLWRATGCPARPTSTA